MTDLLALQDISTRRKSLDGGSMPSSSSRKVDRFLRSGLKSNGQMECDAQGDSNPGKSRHGLGERDVATVGSNTVV